MTKLTVNDYIVKFATPKSVLAKRIGIHRVELYAFLNPQKYPDVSLTEEKLQRIADFEGRSLAAVRNDYASRSKAA